MNLVIYEHKNCELSRLASEHQNTVYVDLDSTGNRGCMRRLYTRNSVINLKHTWFVHNIYVTCIVKTCYAATVSKGFHNLSYECVILEYSVTLLCFVSYALWCI